MSYEYIALTRFFFISGKLPLLNPLKMSPYLLLFLLLPSKCSSTALGPSFAHEPPPLVLFSNSSGLVLDCLARGEPAPIVDWVDEAGNVLPLMPSSAR